MEVHLPFGHILALQLIILGGYGVYVWRFYSDFGVTRYDSSKDTIWAKCTNDGPLCNLTLNTLEWYDTIKIGTLIKRAEAFFLHFEGENQTSQQIWESLGSLSYNRTAHRHVEHIVWSESNTLPPYVDFRVEGSVYSFPTLRRKVPNITLKIEFDSLKKCISTAVSKAQDKVILRYQRPCVLSMLVLNMAKAFLNDNDLGRGKGAVCYLDVSKHTCCKINDRNQKFECSSYNPWMLGIFYTTLIITAVAFWCFPAVCISFPDEKDNLDTICGNMQARNPLYRVANCVAQNIHRYSAEYYFVNMIRKLLIGLVLFPMFFYINWGLEHVITDYKIKQFNQIPSRDDIHTELNEPLMITILIYGAVVMVIALLPRTDSLDFSLSPAYHQKMVKYQRASIINAQNETGLNLMKSSWSLTRKFFIQFCFGFKGFADGQTSLCWRVITFVCSCLLLVIVFPVLAVYILIGYCLYLLPLGRQISILFCYADIYFYWFAWRLTRLCRIGRKRHEKRTSSCGTAPTPNHALYTVVRVIGLLFILAFIGLLYLILISDSLQVFSNLIIYLYIGLLAKNDELLPIITLISIFVLYMWDSCSSVGNKYKTLLEITFHECKRYQRKERNRIIKCDNNGIPRIHRLSDLFRKVCDEIQPIRKLYTIMCVKLVMIALFLSLTYCCISVFGKTRISKLSDAVTVALGGLIPKFVQIFSHKTSSHLKSKEKAYRIKKIVHDFFTSDNASEAKLGEEEINPDVRKSKGSSLNPGSDSSSRRSSECDAQLLKVDVDVNPSQLKSTSNDPVS